MDSSTKIKKNYKLMGTESDPVIIAQRLLNLYRQLHIFSQEKKDAYDKMLLEQPPEIKKSLGALPGGIVVQQYIADLEAEKGLAVENFENDPQPKPVQAEEAPVFVANNQAMPRMAQAQPTVVSVANDPAMIKGIVDAFKEAIVTSEKNRKEDTKELIQTIVALQSKLVQNVMARMPATQAQAPQPQNSTVETKAATVETTKVTTVETRVVSNEATSGIQASQLEDIVAGISRAQSQLIKEMAATQTEQLSRLISRVLKEIQQMSTKTLIDAVQAVHRENMDFFKNQIFSSVSMVPINKEMADDEEYNFPPSFYERRQPKNVRKKQEQIKKEEKNQENYQWEYVEEPSSQPVNSNNQQTNDEEWEYVEDENVNEKAESLEDLSDDEYDPTDNFMEEEYLKEKQPQAVEEEENHNYFRPDETEPNIAPAPVAEVKQEPVADDNSLEQQQNQEEWEYVEEEVAQSAPEEQYSQPVEENVAVAEPQANEEEYEWAYEEEEKPAEPQANEEEYEWSYEEEEVPAEENKDVPVAEISEEPQPQIVEDIQVDEGPIDLDGNIDEPVDLDVQEQEPVAEPQANEEEYEWSYEEEEIPAEENTQEAPVIAEEIPEEPQPQIVDDIQVDEGPIDLDGNIDEPVDLDAQEPESPAETPANEEEYEWSYEEEEVPAEENVQEAPVIVEETSEEPEPQIVEDIPLDEGPVDLDGNIDEPVDLDGQEETPAESQENEEEYEWAYEEEEVPAEEDSQEAPIQEMEEAPVIVEETSEEPEPQIVEDIPLDESPIDLDGNIDEPVDLDAQEEEAPAEAQENEEEYEWAYEEEEIPAEEGNDKPENIELQTEESQSEEQEPSSEDEEEYEWEYVEEEVPEEEGAEENPEQNSEDVLPEPADDTEKTDADNFDDVITDSEQQENPAEPQKNEEEYEWEYVEDENAEAGEDYEWEYVEEDENSTEKNVSENTSEPIDLEAQPISLEGDEEYPQDGEDYEWEYVEEEVPVEENEEGDILNELEGQENQIEKLISDEGTQSEEENKEKEPSAKPEKNSKKSKKKAKNKTKKKSKKGVKNIDEEGNEEQDPYHPQAEDESEQSENPLFANNSFVFDNEENKDNIILDDNFGLSSDDESADSAS